ncbi:MAG TPA: SRPBCC family protein [Myxococcota bacterium]
MQIDVTKLAGLMNRSVVVTERDGVAAVDVIASRVYDTDADDLWNAVTTAERIQRWFLPVEGELKLGGRYQTKGNAGGTITACEPPTSFAATWEMGPFTSWIAVRVTPEGERARLTLTHTNITADNPHFEQYGPGAVGVGWDLGLIGLHLYLESKAQVDGAAVEAWTISDEGKRFVALSTTGWGDADVRSGRDEASSRASQTATYKFYTGT